MSFIVNEIGKVKSGTDGFRLVLDEKYASGLKELENFGHAVVLYWADGCDNGECRSVVECPSPYVGSPETVGVFATRSPARPNPVAITTVGIIAIEGNEVIIDYIDANDDSPIIDLKPYTPSLDRVEKPKTPEWCLGWPGCIEDSGSFDWSKVFQFEE